MQFIIDYSDLDWRGIIAERTRYPGGKYDHMAENILYAEIQGWRVLFETSLFRRLFCKFKYRIIGIKP